MATSSSSAAAVADDDATDRLSPAAAPPAALFCSIGSETTSLSDNDLRRRIDAFLDAVDDGNERQDVLILPPDFTRYHSQAGKLTRMVCEYYGYVPVTTASADTDQKEPEAKKPKVQQEGDESRRARPNIEIMPALGTHAPMTDEEIRKMFGDELAKKQSETFRVHDWRNDVVTIGHVPSELVLAATRGMVDEPWPAQLNKLVWSKRVPAGSDKSSEQQQEGDGAASVMPKKPLVLSIGQVVPHEVMGMANFNKNLFVGTGGVEAINLSHFIGAVYGMENMMGKQRNPLRDILNYASEKYLEKELDLWYILTVVAPDPNAAAGDELCVRGLYIGRDIKCYSNACDLSLKVNFTMLEKPVSRMVTYLDPDEFHSTWLGNKAIYRTRMAMADGGELIILAPGVSRFGEDERVDVLIRKYGYRGTPAVMKAMNDNQELKDSLSAVAHLIHGSSEGRFKVTYCPGHLTKAEIESVGFQYADLDEMSARYDIGKLTTGWQSDQDGEFFFIRNPALGLWAVKSRFENSDDSKKSA